MNILEQYSGRINGTFSFFDRIIVKGYLTRFFTLSGAGSYASQCGVLLKDFSAYAEKVTKQLEADVEKYTSANARPLIYVRSPKESKEDIAAKAMADDPVSEGLICTISAVEPCTTLQPIKNKETGRLELRSVKRKCKHYYFYMKDRELGFMHFRLQTWFPFEAQVYVNGREMMRKIFDENGITYTMYDNSFSSISDIAKAQELADKAADDSRKLGRMFDKLAMELNPYLKTFIEVNGEGYRWYLNQCEYAADIMFKTRGQLEDIYPSLVGHAFYDFSCTDVFTFMGRKLDPRFQGEAVTDYKNRPVGWRVKFKLNSNHIKFYDKANCLRVELTINNPKEFKIYKEVHHRNGETSKQWIAMGKSLSNMYRYAQIGKECNKRLIDAMENIVPVTSVINDINETCARKKVDGRTVTGINVWSEENYFLLRTIADGRYLIHGFRNSDIRGILYPEINDPKKQSAKTSRTIRKLRDHNLLKKIPHSSCYQLTKKGRQVTGALIHMREHMYPEAAARALA